MHLSHPTSADDPPRYSEDYIDSSCSTPFVSAPSSPGHAPPSGYFFSAPASPMHFILSGEKTKSAAPDYEPVFLSSDSGSFEFEFSSRFSPTGTGTGSMTSADELFFNGQIRPMKLSSHLQRPQGNVAPFLDLCGDVRGRDLKARGAKYSHRKARSMSPLRTTAEYEWQAFSAATGDQESDAKENENESSETTPSCSASSSRSSSSGRNSKKWIFLKDLLHRSKSEGRANNKERFWSAISFSPAKERKKTSSSPALSPSSSRDEKNGKSEMKKGGKVPATGKPANGVWRRKVPPSAHELHYTAKRAQAEEMKKKTFLPYRQGLLGCLGFSSKSYGALSGFTKNLNPISSR
ncbi:stress response NST1-like protein [Perilla frutescens var. frutescens]|nr:stress response NST1-like protein [Perilla frutescens var. frutescens]